MTDVARRSGARHPYERAIRANHPCSSILTAPAQDSVTRRLDLILYHNVIYASRKDHSSDHCATDAGVARPVTMSVLPHRQPETSIRDSLRNHPLVSQLRSPSHLHQVARTPEIVPRRIARDCFTGRSIQRPLVNVYRARRTLVVDAYCRSCRLQLREARMVSSLAISARTCGSSAGGRPVARIALIRARQ